MKTTRVNVRMTIKEFNKAKMSAAIYAGGNLSLWIRHCLESYQPKFLKKKR